MFLNFRYAEQDAIRHEDRMAGQDNSNAASRLKAKKSNAMKEIEEWVMKDVGWNDDSRIGKLPENVTEERMFKARLFDLGKERYKYLSKNAFEVHMFVEQRKKKVALQKLNLQVSRSLSANDISSKRRKNEHGKRQEDIDPNDPIANGLTLQRSKTVQFPNTYASNSPAQTRASSRNATQNTFMALRNIQPGRVVTSATAARKASRVNLASRQSDDDSTSSRSWVKKNKFSKYGGSVPGVTSDPRYSDLEGSLSSYYQGRATTAPADVRTIVDDIESLHKPSKTYKEIKPKITQKLQEFMKERGITFM